MMQIGEREELLQSSQRSFQEVEEEELVLLKGTWNENRRLVRKVKLVELQLIEEASTLSR